MDTVMIRSGRVDSLLGKPVTNNTGKILSYNGVAATGASVTASITGDVLTVTVVGSGTLYAGSMLSNAGATVLNGTYIIDQLSGTTGGVGTYRISQFHTTAVGSGTITAVTSSGPKYKDSPWTTFQATVTGTSGTQTATIVIDASNDGINWCSTPIGTITLSGTLTATDGITTVAPWKYVRVRVTAISGTGATVICLMGI